MLNMATNREAGEILSSKNIEQCSITRQNCVPSFFALALGLLCI